MGSKIGHAEDSWGDKRRVRGSSRTAGGSPAPATCCNPIHACDSMVEGCSRCSCEGEEGECKNGGRNGESLLLEGEGEGEVQLGPLSPSPLLGRAQMNEVAPRPLSFCAAAKVQLARVRLLKPVARRRRLEPVTPPWRRTLAKPLCQARMEMQHVALRLAGERQSYASMGSVAELG